MTSQGLSPGVREETSGVSGNVQEEIRVSSNSKDEI